VHISFSEQPEPSLSEIEVLGPGGESEQKGSPEPAPGDPSTLSVPVKPLARGVYTVSWKVVSAIDGHATDGSYAFGVRASPKGTGESAATSTSSISTLELAARWVFLLGMVTLLGAAVAAAARFGGNSGSDLALAGGGWGLSILGLALLAEAQLRTAGTSLGELLGTSVGNALTWRGIWLLGTGAALLGARHSPRRRRPAMAAAAIAAIAAILVHVEAGHAAAGSWPSAIAVSAQVAHFGAAGVWFGGLAALLLGIRGEPSATKTASIRRFGGIALVALVVVFLSGTLRAVDELSSWSQLLTTGYGRAVLAKFVLIALIAGLAARNRRLGVPIAGEDLSPLRRTAKWELAVAVAALGVAALLGTLAPPLAGGSGAIAGLSASGSDFATTTKVDLTAASEEPGPNLFTVRARDYDSGAPAPFKAAALRFTALDDPGVASSSLKLAPRPDGSFSGSGPNLAFEGRWGVDVLLEGSRGAVEIPLELDVPDPKRFVSVQRIPGTLAKYTMQIGSVGLIRIEPDPERPGPSKVYVVCYTPFGSTSLVEQMVVTATADGGPTRQLPLRRLGVGRFVADVDFKPGPFSIAVTAQTDDGTRLRGNFALTIPTR
jgi:copper transport protein